MELADAGSVQFLLGDIPCRDPRIIADYLDKHFKGTFVKKDACDAAYNWSQQQQKRLAEVLLEEKVEEDAPDGDEACNAGATAIGKHTTKKQVHSPKMVLMVSSPETGPDGSGSFTFPVMEKILQLSKTAKNMVVAYDWEGSSNAFSDDQAKFDMIFKDASSISLFKKWCSAADGAKDEVLKEIAPLVKDTRWFASYCGAVKSTIKVYCQKEEEVLLVCIEGGPITRVEAAEMPRLRKEAIVDLEKLGILTPSIAIRNVRSFQEFEQLVENESLFEISKEASIEEGALTEVLNALILDNPHHSSFLKGRQHIKAGNLVEAKECFHLLVTQQASGMLPKELANAKLLLVYTTYKMGIHSLQDKQFHKAAAHLGEALKSRTDAISNERLQKLQLFHACAWYESGKQHREDGDWGAAKKSFDAAKKTKALPSDLQTKNMTYLKECKKMCDAIDDKYDTLDEEGKDEFVHDAGLDEMKAFELYKQAKRSMENGMANQARVQFEEAKEIGLPKALKKRTKKFLRVLEEYEGQEATQCVFSDNCTHLLGSLAITLGLSTTTLGLSTKTVTTGGRCASKDMVMVLDKVFPAGSPERKKLVAQLITDVHKALATISKAADIEITDLVHGSVIVHFRFVSADSNHTAFLEEEYLKQVDDKQSQLYKGEVTCRIDQKRTQTMTVQLGSINSAAQTLCPYRVGDTITLAQIQEQTIECKVESLLGEGATATVFGVMTSGKVCALKVFKAENSFEDLCGEASLILTANQPESHPNVLCADFVWYEQRTREMFFLLELVDGDDLQAWMDDERLYAGDVEQQQKRLTAIAYQLVCGQQHLHRRGIIHGDVKPENVLMTREGKPVLADLGVATRGVIDKGVVTAALRGGTPVYASTKVRRLFFEAKALPVTERGPFLEENKITHRDDFFSLGATVLDMFAECGWRRGRSVAEVLESKSLAELLKDTLWLRVALPRLMAKVLEPCFDGQPTALITVDTLVNRMVAAFSCEPIRTQGGIANQRCADIRNNLAIALYDSGVALEEQTKAVNASHCFEAADTQLEEALAIIATDARSLCNHGVVKLKLRLPNLAAQCFDRALDLVPDHAAATFNRGLVSGRKKRVTAQLDRAGAASVVQDDRGKLELVSAVRFAAEQQLEVQRGGQWKMVAASELNQAAQARGKSLVDLAYRLPMPGETVADASRVQVVVRVQYAPSAQLFVHHGGSWLAGTVHHTMLRGDDQRMVHLIETQSHGRLELELNKANHAPALFASSSTIDRAKHVYTIGLKEKHAFTYDLFSGQKLDTRTQTARLEFRGATRAAKIFAKDDDVDSEEYQRARSASQSLTSAATGTNASEVLEVMLGKDDRATGHLVRYLLLILGPAASGKTTLLKTLVMEIVHRYADSVPILMPVIEVLPVLDKCDREHGESVVAAFVRRKYPQHIHLLLQMMLMRRAVFLIDGIDESGTHRDDVQSFITAELLEPGHKTVITSRHSGFSRDVFSQCQLVELLPLSAQQQAEMVLTRVPNHEKAERLVEELRSPTFKAIASNPLMLTMMISVYVGNNFVVISNRSELYEKALRTMVGRDDKGRAGLGQASQDKVFQYLQKLASGSHERLGERRNFTSAQAANWAGRKGWTAIQQAMDAGRLPIIVNIGRNWKGVQEFRFGHMSYQEYLTGREYYQQLINSQFAHETITKLLGKRPQDAFADPRQQLVLELLAGVFSREQLGIFSAVLFGGAIKLGAQQQTAAPLIHFWAKKKGKMALMGWRRCYFVCDIQRRRATYWATQEAAASNDESSQDYRGTVEGIIGMQRLEQKDMQINFQTSLGRVFTLKMEHEDEAQVLEQRFRAAAVQGIASARVSGSDSGVLNFNGGVRLGRAGAQTLAVYLCQNTTLHTLDISGTEIGNEGKQLLGNALAQSNMLYLTCDEWSITKETSRNLDVSDKELGPADAALLAGIICNNGPISTVIVHKFPLPVQDIKTKAELDLSGKELNHLDAIIIAVFLSLNVSRTMLCRPYCH
jgi:tetratricopeptide (TPR) repeat protein/predicted Ser/Thr protein kinase